MKPKILIDDNIPYIGGRLEPFARVEYVDQFDFNPDNVRDADALIIRTRTRCDSSLLSDSSVGMIATATIGMDQIDIPWCERAGIKVANCPGCNAPAVAQYVWSSLLRKGFNPASDTIGIAGCGNVGSIVAHWGKLLGARVLICDPPRQEAGMPGEYVSLDTLLGESDAVSLHTPLTKTGRHPSFHLISDHEIERMKHGAILINAARGAVLDTEAALPALRTGKITAVIDTWEGEPVINRELLSLSDIATFHIAGYSRQGKERATRMVLEEIDRFFGFETDKSGLAPAYVFPERINVDAILQSYDPACDTDALRADPEAFDILRRNYNYREETPES